MTDGITPARPGSRMWRGRAAPIVTIALMGVTVAAYLLSLVPGWDLQARLAFVPALSAGQPWRALTSTLAHAGPQHLIFNMIGLFLFGGFLERSVGRVFVLVAYIASALGGSLCALLIAWAAPSVVSPLTMFVGASGAVYGLVGVLLTPTRKLDRNWGGVVVYLALGGLYLLIQPNIAWEVHLGGLVVGFVLGCLRLLPRAAVARWAWSVGAAVLLVVMAAGLFA